MLVSTNAHARMQTYTHTHPHSHIPACSPLVHACKIYVSSFLNPADITTKDLMSKPQLLELFKNMPCLPGTRSLSRLTGVWGSVLCSPAPLLRTKVQKAAFAAKSDSRPLLPISGTQGHSHWQQMESSV